LISVNEAVTGKCNTTSIVSDTGWPILQCAADRQCFD